MTVSISKEKFNTFLQYLVAIYAVYANGSWMYFTYPTPLKLFLYVVLITYLIYDANESKQITFPNALIVFLAVFPVLSKFFNIVKDSDLVNTFSTILLYVILGFYKRQLIFDILDKYAKVVFFLCCACIFFRLLFAVIPSLLSFLPISFGGFADVNGYYNLLIYTHRANDDFRSQSIFWEPGAWLFNLIFAFYWFIFVKKQTRFVYIFMLGILQALSTTGFILFLITAIQIWFFSKNKALKKQFTIFALCMAGLVVVASVWLATKVNFDLGGVIYEQVVNKIFDPDSDIAKASAADRLSTTKQAFEIAKDNPIFGIGRQRIEKTLYVTSSISELVYQLGFIYLFVFLYAYRITFNKLNFFISIPFVLIMLNGEAYYPLILSSLIVVFGAKNSFAEKRLLYKPINQSDTPTV